MHHLCLSLHISIKLLSEARRGFCARVRVCLCASDLLHLCFFAPVIFFFRYSVHSRHCYIRRKEKALKVFPPIIFIIPHLAWQADHGCVCAPRTWLCRFVSSLFLIKMLLKLQLRGPDQIKHGASLCIKVTAQLFISLFSGFVLQGKPCPLCCLTPSNSSKGTWGVSKPAVRHNLASVSCVCLWVSSQLDMPELPHMGGNLKASCQMSKPPQLTPFDVQEFLPNDWAPHPVSKGQPRNPLEEAHFRRLYLQSHSFGHYARLVATGEEGNVDQPVNQQLHL